jgi:hypothetical protein
MGAASTTHRSHTCSDHGEEAGGMDPKTRYYETRLWARSPPPDRWDRLFDLLFGWLAANPGYKGSWERLDRWWVEFPATDNGEPWREIGFDAEGVAILAGPSRRNYGFWCDTNMTVADFQEQDEHLVVVSRQDFENAWARFFATADDEPLED